MCLDNFMYAILSKCTQLDCSESKETILNFNFNECIKHAAWKKKNVDYEIKIESIQIYFPNAYTNLIYCRIIYHSISERKEETKREEGKE